VTCVFGVFKHRDHRDHRGNGPHSVVAVVSAALQSYGVPWPLRPENVKRYACAVLSYWAAKLTG
jgi:hypothetical protein